MKANIFDELFVLELASNHWGKVDRGIRIIDEFSKVVRFNNVKAGIKLQIRDIEKFVHKDFRQNEEIRYVKKTMDTLMSFDGFKALVQRIKDNNCIPMATAFDESSAAMCGDLDLDVIKIASSDINDWFLIEAIAELRKPTIVSTAGCSVKNIDDIVRYFENRDIPLAINHCVAMYPTPYENLELNQIDYLVNRYPDNVIGLSTHEDNSTDATLSAMIAYAKGARTFERHVDIVGYDEHKITPYCFTPEQIDKWFKAVYLTKEYCGSEGCKKLPCKSEIKYLRNLHRGAYAKRDLEMGHRLCHDSMSEDIYLAIPCQEGQLSSKELANNVVLKCDIHKDQPLLMGDI